MTEVHRLASGKENRGSFTFFSTTRRGHQEKALGVRLTTD